MLAAAAAEAPVQSAELARQLGAALLEHNLHAIAARDPDEPNRFVAALFFPDSQLLVISAARAFPSSLEDKLAQKRYRDVFLDLRRTQFADGSVFFDDMKADGLCHNPTQAGDALYQGHTTTIFDADWKSHGLTERKYQQLFADADEKYSRLLEILLTQLRDT